MSLKPGHSDCYTCPDCGLTACADCNVEGTACPMNHDGSPDVQMTDQEAYDWVHHQLWMYFTPQGYVDRRKLLVQVHHDLACGVESNRASSRLTWDERMVIAAALIGIDPDRITANMDKVSDYARAIPA